MFEGWSDAKIDKFDVDVEKYDHTNVETKPVVIIAGYCKYQTPYLKIIICGIIRVVINCRVSMNH